MLPIVALPLSSDSLSHASSLWSSTHRMSSWNSRGLITKYRNLGVWHSCEYADDLLVRVSFKFESTFGCTSNQNVTFNRELTDL